MSHNVVYVCFWISKWVPIRMQSHFLRDVCYHAKKVLVECASKEWREEESSATTGSRLYTCTLSLSSTSVPVLAPAPSLVVQCNVMGVSILTVSHSATFYLTITQSSTETSRIHAFSPSWCVTLNSFLSSPSYTWTPGVHFYSVYLGWKDFSFDETTMFYHLHKWRWPEIVELVQFLFTVPGVTVFLNRLCQDPLKKFFGQQRQRGKVNEKPNLTDFLKKYSSTQGINGVWRTVKGNCNGSTDVCPILRAPLQKRSRKHKWYHLCSLL